MFVGWAVVRRREFAEIAKRIAETLKWLIDAAYAGRKIMLWAHNAHVMNARYGPGFGSVSPEPLKDGMMPSGVWFTDSYGDSLYKIGFTAYQGSDGWVGAPSAPVAPAPPVASKRAFTGSARPRSSYRRAAPAGCGHCSQHPFRCAFPNTRWRRSPTRHKPSTLYIYRHDEARDFDRVSWGR